MPCRLPHQSSRAPFRALVLLATVFGLQLIPLERNAQDLSPDSARLSAGLPVAGAALPSGTAEVEPNDGDGSSPGAEPSPHASAPRATAPDGALSDVFGPWLASDALDRAGRRSAPPTAPPTSPA